jgi:hypothetical protein
LPEDKEIWCTFQISYGNVLLGMYNPRKYSERIGKIDGIPVVMTGDCVALYDTYAVPSADAKAVINRLAEVTEKEGIGGVVGVLPATISILDRILLAGAIQSKLDEFAKVVIAASLASLKEAAVPVQTTPVITGMFGFMPPPASPKVVPETSPTQAVETKQPPKMRAEIAALMGQSTPPTLEKVIALQGLENLNRFEVKFLEVAKATAEMAAMAEDDDGEPEDAPPPEQEKGSVSGEKLSIRPVIQQLLDNTQMGAPKRHQKTTAFLGRDDINSLERIALEALMESLTPKRVA